jgi:Ca2+-transporting ATPase
LARCSPSDKFDLVSLLKQQGEVVAVTGDGTNDAPALKEANVGFSMGISGTQIAMNASDIVLLDDNFASIVQAVRWGRNVLCVIRKFLQFQLGINACAVIVTFLGSVMYGASPLSTVQLLWINLIMDSFGAIGLASDDPDSNILNEPPQRKTDSLLTTRMRYYIAVQTFYQTFVLLFLLTAADIVFPIDLMGYHKSDNASKGVPSIRTETLVFNTFILMQLTNLICARQLNGEINMFGGFFKNRYFVVILLIIGGFQIFCVSVAYSLFNCVSLSIPEWGICAMFAAINIPVVSISKLIFHLYNVSVNKKESRRVVAEEDSGSKNMKKDFKPSPTILGISEDVEDIEGNLEGRKRLPEVRGKIRNDNMPMSTKTRTRTMGSIE